ncbi:hypothetical protein HY490_00540 [Candidatus Woesearchaeota archaeon]|nr:hypothetical protein [Candidatus Woesearchaeota archaeon]
MKSYEQDERYAGPQPLPAEVVQRFEYGTSVLDENPFGQFAASDLVERVQSLYFTREVRSFSSEDRHVGSMRTITFEYYRTALAEHPPLVMVLPILGGDYPIERSVCEMLAEHGISSVLVHRPPGILDPQTYQSLEVMILSLTADRRKTLDVIVASGEVDMERMGSFGISMGAITGVPLIAVEQRLQYHVLGLAGGDIPSIIMESSEDAVEEFVDEAMSAFGLSRAQLLDRLRSGYCSDPAELAPFIDARNVRMFLARFDWVVPLQYGMVLHERMGRPQLDVLPVGHYTAALFYFWVKDVTCEFFQEKFGVDGVEVERRRQEIVRSARRQRSDK